MAVTPASLFDQVWVVSLPSAHDRRAHIQKHLPEMGFPQFSFFDAIASDDIEVSLADREVLKYPPCFRCGKLDCGKPDCNNFLTPAQIAVYLTYRKLWRTIADGPARRVLVVEDDVWFHAQTPRVLSWIEEQVEKNGLPFRAGERCLLRMGWKKSEEHDDADAPIWADMTIKWANPCHALTREFAQALLERYAGITHTVDVFLHQTGVKENEAFTIHPPIASELSWTEGRFASQVLPKPSRVAYLKSQGQDSAATEAERQLAHYVKKKHFRPLLVTGHPRGGTGYAANLCAQLGVDVGHEKLGAGGISSWMFAVEAQVNPYARDEVARTRRAFAWRYMIAAVRDLTTAAASVMRDSEHAPPSYEFRRDYIRIKTGVDLDTFSSPFERAVRSLTGWMKIIMLQQPDLVFRIEDQHDLVKQFLIKAGLVHPSKATLQLDTAAVNADKPYKGVRYAKDTVTQADWHSLSDESKQEVKWYCETFGYTSPLSAPKTPDISRLTQWFLDPSGWSRSRTARAPQRSDGSALPWFTYGAIEFLHQIVRPTDRVFEYGAGYSTLWWQENVADVASVEHDPEWVAQLRPRLRKNVTLEARPIKTPASDAQAARCAPFFGLPRRTQWTYEPERVVRRGLDDASFVPYATFIDEADPSMDGFDFIIVDGMARRLCTWMALSHVKPNGFIILDNSNRSDYDLAYALLDHAGFRQIPFWGLVPGADFMTNTSFFTRSIERLPSGKFAGNSFKLPEY